MNVADKRKQVQRLIATESESACALADAIHGFAEPGFREVQSAKCLTDYLKANRFTVTYPFPDLPTTFMATAGRSRPSIGFLAEYDALPDCGHEPGTYGHGCGHNLLGTAAATAAVATAKWLEHRNQSGQIVVWGCPAEEQLAGKVFMARDGAFQKNDAVLAWHPSHENTVSRDGGAALDSLLFEFFGLTAHASYAERGRSALDGAILMDVAANYLREHIPENVRIHMCLREGGRMPNVVPDYAKAWYYIRGKDRTQVDDIRRRLINCAKGAALATETRMRMTRLAGLYNRLPNDTLADTLMQNLKLFGPPRPSQGDIETARMMGSRGEFTRTIAATPARPTRASSDEDNVSWLTPFCGTLKIACYPKGVQVHHREMADHMALDFAHRGMLKAAEILAGTAVDLVENKPLLVRARAEFKRRRHGFRYDPLVLPRQKPVAMVD